MRVQRAADSSGAHITGSTTTTLGALNLPVAGRWTVQVQADEANAARAHVETKILLSIGAESFEYMASLSSLIGQAVVIFGMSFAATVTVQNAGNINVTGLIRGSNHRYPALTIDAYYLGPSV